jgi:hypothetical protein
VIVINGLAVKLVPRKPDGSLDISKMQTCKIVNVPRRKRNKKSIRKEG